MKLKLNDIVLITTGKDRGKTGQITKIVKKTNKVVVDGINKRIKHVKGREGRPGERVEYFAPIHASNVSILDPKTKKPTKIGYRIEGKEKVRFARKSGEVIAATAKIAKVSKKAEKAAPKTKAKK